MVGHFFISMHKLRKRFSTKFRALIAGPNPTSNNRLDTAEDLGGESKKTEREFMYLNKKICSDITDQNRQFQNSDNQKKFNLLSPH